MMKIIIDENKWNSLKKSAKEENVYVADLLLALYMQDYVLDIVVDTDEVSNELSYFDEKLKEYNKLSKRQQNEKKSIQKKYRFRNLRNKRISYVEEGIVKEDTGVRYSKITRDKTGKVYKDPIQFIEKKQEK